MFGKISQIFEGCSGRDDQGHLADPTGTDGFHHRYDRGDSDHLGLYRDSGPTFDLCDQNHFRVRKEIPMALRWYVVHTYSGHEQKAKKYLESAVANAGMDGEIRPGSDTDGAGDGNETGETVDLDQEISPQLYSGGDGSGPGRPRIWWYRHRVSLILSAPPESRIRCRRMKWSGLSDRLIIPVTAEATDMPYQAGDSVKVIDGPFADFSGFVSEVNLERKKIKVMVSIFGRPTPVELDFLQIEPVKQKA